VAGTLSGRLEAVADDSAMEKSDLPEVARKRANKAASAAAEPVERRGGAMAMSGSAISAFRHRMIERWHGALMRRRQRRRLTWTRMRTIADRYPPFRRILHPWPEKRFLVTIQGGSPVR
jgi:hypothetical protein